MGRLSMWIWINLHEEERDLPPGKMALLRTVTNWSWPSFLMLVLLFQVKREASSYAFQAVRAQTCMSSFNQVKNCMNSQTI